jgi:predicted metalloendopeptidase
MKNMFQLAGDKPQAASLKATMVMEFETTLAKHSLDRVAMRDPNKTYNMKPAASWPKSMPASLGRLTSRPWARPRLKPSTWPIPMA